MYILDTGTIQFILTEEEEKAISEMLIATQLKFFKFKGQTIQSAFVRGIYDLKTYYAQEQAKLSGQGKWRCMKCGSVLRFSDRCECGQSEYSFLAIKNNQNLLN